MQRKTVVLVCMVDSIHVARWIAQFDPTEVKFVLFPSGPNRRVHPKIVEMIERGKRFDDQMTMVPFGGKLSLPLWALDRFFSDRIRGLLLRRILKKLRPDFVHALEFQHAGYITIRALEDRAIDLQFIATNYGSDIYWFQRFPKHKAKIQKILERADKYSAECQRDYLLAQSLGFDGLDLPLGPNAGGIEPRTGRSQMIPASERKTIAIKGYQGWVGRALVALEAVDLLQKELKDYEIVIYSANLRVARKAKRIQKMTGLKFTLYMKSALSHSEMLEVFERSRIYIGLSLSDGISTSLLEAMAAGAFPIQTSTSCADEWVENGKTGLLIKNIVKERISSYILQALEDDELVNQAQVANSQKIKENASPSHFVSNARIFYQLNSGDEH